MNKNFTFRCPADIREKLEERAAKEGRSLANLVIFILREYINNNN